MEENKKTQLAENKCKNCDKPTSNKIFCSRECYHKYNLKHQLGFNNPETQKIYGEMGKHNMQSKSKHKKVDIIIETEGGEE